MAAAGMPAADAYLRALAATGWGVARLRGAAADDLADLVQAVVERNSRGEPKRAHLMGFRRLWAAGGTPGWTNDSMRCTTRW